MRYPNEELNCTEPSPSVSVPWPKLQTALNIVKLIDTVTVTDTLAGLFEASFANVMRALAYGQSFFNARTGTTN